MEMHPQHLRVPAVSIGGGTGQPNAIRVMRELHLDVSAIVAMADDGGSTGILRDKAGMIPPGDVRKCLVAMAKDPSSSLARALEHRFSFADGHTLGNLLLTALALQDGSFVDAIKTCARMLEVCGGVYPSTLELIELCGQTMDGHEFRGQVNVSDGPSPLNRVWLSPHNPQPYAEALQAIRSARLIVLGPGSLFSSVIPNLLVPGITQAIEYARSQGAVTVFICSMADMQLETWGMTAEEHVEALLAHGMEGMLDFVFIHRKPLTDMGIATRTFARLTGDQIAEDAERRRMGSAIRREECDGYTGFIRPIQVSDASLQRLSARVGEVIVRDFSDQTHPTWHNTAKLASALEGVLAGVVHRRG